MKPHEETQKKIIEFLEEEKSKLEHVIENPEMRALFVEPVQHMIGQARRMYLGANGHAERLRGQWSRSGQVVDYERSGAVLPGDPMYKAVDALQNQTNLDDIFVGDWVLVRYAYCPVHDSLFSQCGCVYAVLVVGINADGDIRYLDLNAIEALTGDATKITPELYQKMHEECDLGPGDRAIVTHWTEPPGWFDQLSSSQKRAWFDEINLLGREIEIYRKRQHAYYGYEIAYNGNVYVGMPCTSLRKCGPPEDGQ